MSSILTRSFALLLLLLLPELPAWAKAPDNLQTCWKQQARPVQTTYLALRYHETLAQLEHSFQPW